MNRPAFGSFVDRLLAYIENFCGFPRLSRAIRGVPEERLADTIGQAAGGFVERKP